MRILDLDLDAFINGIAYDKSVGEERLSDEEYQPITEGEMRYFLEKQCGLMKDKKVKGRIVTNHDEAFHFWIELSYKGLLNVPFEVVHVDGHADLGHWGSEVEHICTELLHLKLEDRIDNILNSNKLNIGNYLLYSCAARMIKKINFVHHPDWRPKRTEGKDLVDMIKKEIKTIYNDLSHIDILKILSLEYLKNLELDAIQKFHLVNKAIEEIEIEIGFKEPASTVGKNINDLLYFYFYENRIDSNFIQLKSLSKKDYDKYGMDSRNLYKLPVVNFEPKIDFNITHIEDYKENKKIDYIVLCQSPEYTPPKADFLIPIIKEYIDII